MDIWNLCIKLFETTMAGLPGNFDCYMIPTPKNLVPFENGSRRSFGSVYYCETQSATRSAIREIGSDETFVLYVKVAIEEMRPYPRMMRD